MNFLSEIFHFLTTPQQAAPAGVCVLPPPPAPRERGKKVEKEPGVYDIEVQYTADGRAVSGTFGFREAKEADREGAVMWLTELDKAALRQRELWGGAKVAAQNEAAKKAWASGDTVADCSRVLRLSESWVEKRYGAFSAALSSERGA